MTTFPLINGEDTRVSKQDEATATCFCGAVQLAFPTKAPGLVDTFVCNCTDCRKITASMFASNFTILDTYLKHVRGEDNLQTYSEAKTIESQNTMTNSFCRTCGTLLYRVSSGLPGQSILRIGTIDDFELHETKFKPRIEQFTRSRVGWFTGVQGNEVRKFTNMHMWNDKGELEDSTTG